MPTLTIRNVGSEVRDHLRQQAAKHGRSMEAEVREILAKDLQRKQTNPGAVARRIHQRFAEIGGGDDLPLPEREPLADPVTFDQ